MADEKPETLKFKCMRCQKAYAIAPPPEELRFECRACGKAYVIAPKGEGE